MAGQVWKDATLYDEDGEFALAQVRYSLGPAVEIDGFPHVRGGFVLREELCPLHTGLAQLRTLGEPSQLVRILRLTRPRGDGDLEVVEPLSL